MPGYYEAVTHSGITVGPVIGRLLAEEILTGTRDELLADFAWATSAVITARSTRR